jgi:hypothetical protein
MAKTGDTIKKTGFLLLMGALFIPLCQELFGFFEIKPLKGSFDVAPKPELNRAKWFDGSFQAEKEKYINEQYGGRNFMVRLNNQLDYWLFREIHAELMIHGKNGMLLGTNYIEAYLGDKFAGEARINAISKRLRKIQEKMNEKNKTLIILLAPGKATFYPEYFPDKYKRQKKRNNHEEFASQLKEKGVNTIDMNTWFLSMKGKTKYPLFTEHSIHWTVYGSFLAYDSLVKYIEKKRNTDLPDHEVIGYETPDTLREPDDDIFRACNTFFGMPFTKTAYPVIRMKNEEGKTRPSCLTVGDSYWRTIRSIGVDNSVFANQRFWFYNKDAYPETKPDTWPPVSVSSLNFGEVIEKTDVIIICQTESTLEAIGDGFIEQLFKYYYPEEQVLSQEEKKKYEKEMMEFIRNDQGWMEGLRKKSKETGIPLDSLILYDARWQVDHKY